jgi:hypothetical protein
MNSLGEARFGRQQEKIVRDFARFTAATTSGYGSTAVPFHHSLSSPNTKTARCRCQRRIRIASRSHKTDDVPTFHPCSLPQPFQVPVQVRVVVAIHPHFIELVYCVPAPVLLANNLRIVPDTTACERVREINVQRHKARRRIGARSAGSVDATLPREHCSSAILASLWKDK